MTASPTLRVGVVGAGAMGADHVTRISERISGADVTAIVEPDAGRLRSAILAAPRARPFARLESAIEAGAIDAVLVATPGRLHEAALLAGLEARLAIFCEKPLATDPAAARRIVEAERRLDRPHIQVGFMRRFDVEHQELRALVASGGAGSLLLLHCVHRNRSVPDGYTQDMLITDSVVHELDAVPWLAGSPIRALEVRHPRRNSRAPERLSEPILVLLELQNGVLADVEMNVSAELGYQVATEAVLERGVARIGQPSGLQRWQEGRVAIAEPQSFTTRFRDAYDRQVQSWVEAAHRGTVAGPNAWDGLMVALACEAGLQALYGGGRIEIPMPERPAFYAVGGAPGS
ncbi:MAG: Gfo/Idh/MocA family oxidoreductase [Candidatus Dormiibacterota bacterium]